MCTSVITGLEGSRGCTAITTQIQTDVTIYCSGNITRSAIEASFLSQSAAVGITFDEAAKEVDGGGING